MSLYILNQHIDLNLILIITYFKYLKTKFINDNIKASLNLVLNLY